MRWWSFVRTHLYVEIHWMNTFTSSLSSCLQVAGSPQVVPYKNQTKVRLSLLGLFQYEFRTHLPCASPSSAGLVPELHCFTVHLCLSFTNSGHMAEVLSALTGNSCCCLSFVWPFTFGSQSFFVHVTETLKQYTWPIWCVYSLTLRFSRVLRVWRRTWRTKTSVLPLYSTKTKQKC